MQKIVVVCKTPADWAFDYIEDICFIYESPESWLIDFEELLILSVKNKLKDWEDSPSEFVFCGKTFTLHDFCNIFGDGKTIILPEVYSLDEWFEKNCNDKLN